MVAIFSDALRVVMEAQVLSIEGADEEGFAKVNADVTSDQKVRQLVYS